MFIIAEWGLWSVVVSNNVVYNSVLLYKMPWAAEPWVMAQPRGSAASKEFCGANGTGSC